MTDNRELDILVAKTLGYSVRKAVIAKEHIQYFLDAPKGFGYRVRPSFTEEDEWLNVPQFSIDIAEAMKLVPESDKDHSFWLKRLSHVWSATIEDYSLSPDACYFNEDGDTAAEAIVLAWLAWKGVDNER